MLSLVWNCCWYPVILDWRKFWRRLHCSFFLRMSSRRNFFWLRWLGFDLVKFWRFFVKKLLHWIFICSTLSDLPSLLRLCTRRENLRFVLAPADFNLITYFPFLGVTTIFLRLVPISKLLMNFELSFWSLLWVKLMDRVESLFVLTDYVMCRWLSISELALSRTLSALLLTLTDWFLPCSKFVGMTSFDLRVFNVYFWILPE